jgi:hypothetical protein
LRPQVERARRAVTDLARLTDLPADATPSHPNDLVAELALEIGRTWGAAGTNIGTLRAMLHALAANAPALEAQLSHLRHAQHHALHEAQWAEVAHAVNHAHAARDALATAEQESRMRMLALEAAERAFVEAQARVLAAPDGITPESRGLRDALALATVDGLLEMLDVMGVATPRVSGDAVTRLHAIGAAVALQRDGLTPQHQQLMDEVARHERALAELLG